MNPILKPIKTINIISFALHVSSIFFVILLVLMRYQIATYLYGYQGFEGGMPLPSLLIVLPIVANFAVHAILAALFHKSLQSNSDLKALSIISLALAIIVIPLLSYFLSFFTAFFHARHSIDYLVAQNIMQSMIGFALILRMFGISALIITSSMSLYHVYCQKSQQKNGEHHGE